MTKITGVLFCVFAGLALTACDRDGVDGASSESTETRTAGSAFENWPRTPSYDVAFDPLNPLSVTSIGEAPPQFDPEDDYWGLPRTEGYELVYVYCSGCHSLEIVMQQSAAKERWRYMIDWMSEKQNMQPMPPEDDAVVFNYLVQYFGADDQSKAR